jgi:hypothetical protein
MAINLYFIGTAGSGKTTLCKAFHDWMRIHGYNSITINLDPGVDYLPYAPDIDIRDWIVLSDIMAEYNLGPNGAQIVCADMLALKAGEVKKVIETFRADYILIDLPGQIELFNFRTASNYVINTFGIENTIIAFLFDPVLSKTPSGFVSLLMLCATVQFRFGLPTVNVLAKSDVLNKDEIEKTLLWSKDFYSLYNALMDSKPEMHASLNIELFKALENLGTYKTLIPVSAEKREGLEDLYDAAQEVYMGGEDLSKD